MLAAQIPPDADIAAQLPADGDYVLYRACAAHLAQDASLLSAESADEDSADVVPNVRQEEDFAPAFAGDEGWGGAEDIRGLPRLVCPHRMWFLSFSSFLAFMSLVCFPSLS